MKIGLCLNMIAKGPDGTGREWIPYLCDMEIDYAEIAVAQVMALDESEFRKTILIPLRQTGLPCLCCNNFFPATYRLTGNEADHPSAIAYARFALDRAAELGAEHIVFGSSGARNRPNGVTREVALFQLSELLHMLGDLARERGITIVLESLNRLESNLMNNIMETYGLMRRVSHPNVRMLVDAYHTWMAGDTADDVQALGTDVRHVHVARTLGRGLPSPGDDEPWQDLFNALQHNGYQGGASIESIVIGNDVVDQIRGAAHFLRSFIR